MSKHLHPCSRCGRTTPNVECSVCYPIHDREDEFERSMLSEQDRFDYDYQSWRDQQMLDPADRTET